MKVIVECFKTLKDFKNNAKFRKGNGKAGVYIWGFSLEKEDFTIPSSLDNFFPYYVGKHYRDMYSRTHEHISTLAGGNFSIFDILSCVTDNTKIGLEQKKYIKASKLASLNGGPILPNPEFPNLLYFPEGVHRQYNFFFDNATSKQIDWMLRHFCIIYIYPESNFSSKNLDILEKKIGQLFEYDRLITKPYKNIDDSFKLEIISKSEIITINKLEDLLINCFGVK